jgi:hypothetical protein
VGLKQRGQFQNNAILFLFPKAAQTLQIFQPPYGWSGGDASHKVKPDEFMMDR